MKFDDDDLLDRWVARTAMQVPDGFAARVMTRLPTRAPLVARIRVASISLALVAGALGGLTQLLLYVFGIWMATAAG